MAQSSVVQIRRYASRGDDDPSTRNRRCSSSPDTVSGINTSSTPPVSSCWTRVGPRCCRRRCSRVPDALTLAVLGSKIEMFRGMPWVIPTYGEPSSIIFATTLTSPTHALAPRNARTSREALVRPWSRRVRGHVKSVVRLRIAFSDPSSAQKPQS
jgi:hypothetical protein